MNISLIINEHVYIINANYTKVAAIAVDLGGWFGTLNRALVCIT